MSTAEVSPMALASPASAPVKTEYPGLSNKHITTLFSARLVMCSACRVVYPLLPFLAVHFAIDLKTASLLVTAGFVSAMAASVTGSLSDKLGSVRMMRAGLVLFIVGTLISSLSADFNGFLYGYFCMGLSTIAFFIAMQSYVASCIAYDRRGRVLSLLEISWGLAGLGGVPLLAYTIINSNNLSTPFLSLAVLSLIILIASFSLPKEIRQTKTSRKAFGKSLLTFNLCALMCVWMLFLFGIEQVLVCASAATKQFFGADDMQVSIMFAFLGIAEMIGSALGSVFVDRFTKRQTLVAGLITLAFSEALLPLSVTYFPIFFAILFVFAISIEFTFIPIIVLFSGARPEARGSVIALTMFGEGVARAISSMISIPLWQALGFSANAILAVTLTTLAVLIALRRVSALEKEGLAVN